MLTQVDSQHSLGLTVVREQNDQTADSTVSRQPSLLAAIALCVRSSGLLDNRVAQELEIQEAQFSRILKGDAHFPPNKLNALMDVCGNEIPLRWMAMSRGYGLVRLKSEVEKENEALRQKLRDEQLKNEVLAEALRGGK